MVICLEEAMRVTLTMDEETARAVMRAAEFYARVVCGQYEIIADDVMGVSQVYHACGRCKVSYQ